jgi:hypothetical protein
MSQELTQYKNYRLIELKNTYNNNCIINIQYYNTIINSILNSRILNKTQQINNVKNVLTSVINNLTNKYNSDILVIKQFVPNQIVINKNKNKKALLVGINYTGTQNELYGCINDVNSIKERIIANGFTNINTITDLTTQKPTKNNILSEFKNLLINSQAGDLLLLIVIVLGK